MKVLAYIKFPRKHTLSQRLTCKKFIREASLDHPRLESCGAERKISRTVLQSQQRPQMTLLELWNQEAALQSCLAARWRSQAAIDSSLPTGSERRPGSSLWLRAILREGWQVRPDVSCLPAGISGQPSTVYTQEYALPFPSYYKACFIIGKYAIVLSEVTIINLTIWIVSCYKQYIF